MSPSPFSRNPANRSSIILCALTACLALPSPAPAQPAGTPAGFPGRGGAGRPVRTPLPDSGSSSAFTYQKSPEGDGTYVVTPTGAGVPVTVSSSILGLVVGNAQTNDEAKWTTLRNYPNMVEGMQTQILDQNYPDSTSPAPDNPYAGRTLGTKDQGASAVVEDDPMAPGYLRVSLADETGKVEEVSIARKTGEKLLENPKSTDEAKLKAIKSYPFKLPEDARKDFKTLSKAEIIEKAKELPDMKRQEFVKMSKLYADNPSKRGEPSAVKMSRRDGTTSSTEDTTLTEELRKLRTKNAPARTPEPRGAEPAPPAKATATAAPAETTATARPAAEPAGFSGTAVLAAVVLAAGLAGAAGFAMRRKQ